MIESFFIWFLGEHLAIVSFIVFGAITFFGFAGLMVNAFEILKWLENRNKEK